MIEIEEKEEFVQTVEKPLSLSKRGLGRSPKAGRRDELILRACKTGMPDCVGSKIELNGKFYLPGK